MISSDEFFKISPNYYFDEIDDYIEKDFESIFRTTSNMNSPGINKNNHQQNYDDFNSLYRVNIQIARQEKMIKKQEVTLGIILHIKTLFFNKEFKEILNFLQDNFWNVININ